MDKYSEQNKIAWEYNVYDFWMDQSGLPSERAKKDLENPQAMLKRYSKYLGDVSGLKIANICGSCGKKAIPLAILGAEVSVFDISEENKRYTCETAQIAGIHIDYIVGDVIDIDRTIYSGYFDIVFMEGGVLHYFHNINQFMSIMYDITKNGGKLICSDFHPFTKIIDILQFENYSMDYFSTEIVECEMPHAKFYEDDLRKRFPKCSLRRYNISEIINAVIDSGFTIQRFDEHRAWTNDTLPGEFTIIAIK